MRRRTRSAEETSQAFEKLSGEARGLGVQRTKGAWQSGRCSVRTLGDMQTRDTWLCVVLDRLSFLEAALGTDSTERRERMKQRMTSNDGDKAVRSDRLQE